MAIAIHMPQLRDTGTSSVRRSGTTLAGRSNYRRTWSEPQPQVLIEYQHLLKNPMAGQRIAELWHKYALTASKPRLDKGATLTALNQLRALPVNWSGYGAIPIDHQVIRAAKDFILTLPSDIITTPKVVPMTRGRLQFEWHRGSRSLEIEFESSDQLHFLKWDSDVNIEEENVIPVDDTGTIHALLRWFASESVNV